MPNENELNLEKLNLGLFTIKTELEYYYVCK